MSWASIILFIAMIVAIAFGVDKFNVEIMMIIWSIVENFFNNNIIFWTTSLEFLHTLNRTIWRRVGSNKNFNSDWTRLSHVKKNPEI